MTRHRIRGRHVIAPVVLTLGCAVSACSSGPHVSAQQQRAVAGILQPPHSSTTAPARATTRTTTATHAGPDDGTTPTGPSSSTPSTSVTTAPPSSASSPGAAPNVVGQSLSAGESRLQAAGFGIAAHPWAASCSTANLIMQQVPPQDGNVQLFYCADPS